MDNPVPPPPPSPTSSPVVTPPPAPSSPPPPMPTTTTSGAADFPPPPPPISSSPSPASSNPPPPPRPAPPPILKKLLLGLGALLVLGALAVGGWMVYQNMTKSQTTTITYWGLWEPESVMRPILDEYEAAHKNIKVKYEMHSLVEYRERLQSSLARGQGPDVYRIHNSWVPMFSSSLSPVPADVYSAQSFATTFYPSATQTLRVGSNYVAVPLGYDGLAMYINNDIFRPTGLSVPNNWDELRDAAIAMAKCQSEAGLGPCQPGAQVVTSGVAMGTTNNVDHWQDIVAVLMLQNNVNLAAPRGKPAQDAVDYYANFTTLYHMWNRDLPSSTTQFAQGKVGIYFGPSWRVFDIKAINPNLNFTIHPLPQLPIDPQKDEKHKNWASFWVEGVNNKSEHQAEAWELLKYLSTPEILEKISQSAQVNGGRDFGQPYPRRDMADQIKDHPQIGPYIQQAELAHTWYLASATRDGENGINTQLSRLYAQMVDHIASPEALVPEITKVLSAYGLQSSVLGQETP